MLDTIISLVKEQAASAIGNIDIPADKKDATIETTTTTIVDGITNQLSSGGLYSITSLFGGDSSSNSFVSTIQSTLGTALTDKVGLSPTIVNTITSTVVPAVINLISKKSNDSSDSFNLESLVDSISGGVSGKSDGGILGALGKLFGK